MFPPPSHQVKLLRAGPVLEPPCSPVHSRCLQAFLSCLSMTPFQKDSLDVFFPLPQREEKGRLSLSRLQLTPSQWIGKIPSQEVDVSQNCTVLVSPPVP